MRFEPGQLYHVYNRGNNRQQVFFTPDHYLYFLKKLRGHVRPRCHILAYCLMPNHFHILLCPTLVGVQEAVTTSHTKQALTQGLAVALSSYTQGLNKERGTSGSLFQSRTKALLLTAGAPTYPQACFHYIHQNPVRAGLTPALADWPYSSYRDYAGLRSGTLCDQALAQELLDLPLNHIAFQLESAKSIDPDRVKGWL